MKRILFLLGILVLPPSFALAADEDPAPATTPSPAPSSPWKKQVVAKYSLNQAHFDNWAAGGSDTFAWEAGLLAAFERDGLKGDWKNTLHVDYGRSKSNNQVSVKTADELFLETVYSLKWAKWVNPFVAGSFQTQMDKGFDTKVTPQVQTSQFMDPGYFTESVGLSYDNKKNFTTRLGAAVKETVTNRFISFANDSPTGMKKTRTEPGVNSVSEFKAKLSSQTLFTTSLNLFTNLKAADQMYSRWSNMLTVKATKYLDMTAEFELLYDGHTSTRRQMRQGLGLGLSYTVL